MTPVAPYQQGPITITARGPCLHPLVGHVDGAGVAACKSCPQRFGLCRRHGMFAIELGRCPRCPKAAPSSPARGRRR